MAKKLTDFLTGQYGLSEDRYATITGLSVLLPCLVLAAAVIQPWIDPKWLFFDFLTAAEFSDDCCHVYYGLLSNIGIFMWVSTSAICLFSALLFFMRTAWSRRTIFALTAGLLSGWLGLDDAFLLHEVVFPKLGIGQTFVVSTYVALTLAYVATSWRLILASEFWILGLAGLGVGTSLLIDQLIHSIDSQIIVYEDSAKFFGIFCWFLFHLVTLTMIFKRLDKAKA